MALSYSAGAISAKARAMYGRCLTRQDYKNLLSCHNVGEVAAYLKTRTHYADVLADINEGTVHRGYLEAVIRRKLFDDYESLMHYDRSMNQRLSDYYIKKSEIQQIMHCLHLMRAGRMQDFLFSVPAFLARVTHLDLKGLACAKTFEDVVEAARQTPYAALLRPFLPCRMEELPMTAVENALTSYLFSTLFAEVQGLSPGERREMLRLFGTQIDAINVSRIRRMKKYFHMRPEEIRQNLLPVTGNLSKAVMQQMVEAETDAQVLELFFSTAGKHVEESQRANVDDMPLRLPYFVARRYMHFSTYPLVVFASYIIITEIEQDDLINIIEGIRYSLPPADIQSMLVLGGSDTE